MNTIAKHNENEPDPKHITEAQLAFEQLIDEAFSIYYSVDDA